MVDFGGKNYHLCMDKSGYDEEDISDVQKQKPNPQSPTM